MLSKRNIESGFSLAELMVVVAIIGILTFIAMPKLQIFVAKAKQTEAKINLRTIANTQQAYFNENGFFACLASDVGIDTMRWKYYEWANWPCVTPKPDNFLIRAVSKDKLCPGAVRLDRWSVDHNSNLSQEFNGIEGC
jgi:prepilin-type N-terminal cleavage/methylation domain-containing protein